MCEYSLHMQRTRDAVIGDMLETCKFSGTPTRGLCSPSNPNVAVCLKPGTEVAFAATAVSAPPGILWWRRKRHHGTVAVFRKLDVDPVKFQQHGHTHTDALEFSGGETVLLTRLVIGQRVTVLQLPVEEFVEVPHHAVAVRRIEITEDAGSYS